MSDKELLALIFRKGVAIGFITMLEKECLGGVQEYNDFIGDKKLHLHQDEYDAIVMYYLTHPKIWD